MPETLAIKVELILNFFRSLSRLQLEVEEEVVDHQEVALVDLEEVHQVALQEDRPGQVEGTLRTAEVPLVGLQEERDLVGLVDLVQAVSLPLGSRFDPVLIKIWFSFRFRFRSSLSLSFYILDSLKNGNLRLTIDTIVWTFILWFEINVPYFQRPIRWQTGRRRIAKWYRWSTRIRLRLSTRCWSRSRSFGVRLCWRTRVSVWVSHLIFPFISEYRETDSLRFRLRYWPLYMHGGYYGNDEVSTLHVQIMSG